ncbi:unnamed protein product [Mytilus edulis]|uniref:Paired domain-containing protein n=1 Tax=Mytilus edulis TaxID=6550 RepID=A0A8S3UE84_MYTED|nr:unnamed protein product [Mytilus edulis]
MARQKLSIAERWQVVGMANTGLICRRIAVHFGVNHTLIIRLVQRYRQTGSVENRPIAGGPRKTTPREDRNLSRQARLKPFTSADQLHRLWPIGETRMQKTIMSLSSTTKSVLLLVQSPVLGGAAGTIDSSRWCCWYNRQFSVVLLVQSTVLGGAAGTIDSSRWCCWYNRQFSVVLLVQSPVLGGAAGTIDSSRWYCWYNRQFSVVLLVQSTVLGGAAGTIDSSRWCC